VFPHEKIPGEKVTLYVHPYKSKLRSLIAQNPMMTQREMQARLERDGLHLDRQYLGALLNGIYAERAKRADTSLAA
jgi:hypothetical protein